MIDALKTGAWLNARRVRMIALMALLTTILSIAYILFTAHGTVDYTGRPVGTDFSNVWTAGRMALDGMAAQAWNWDAHHAVQVVTHGRADIPFYGWHYPPPFLLVSALLATLPYLPALFVWQASSLAAVLLTLRSIDQSRMTMLVALSAPVVMTCLTHGHNGFLTGALLGGGLLLLDKRPWLAGALLGCVIYKPQFGLVIPVVLLVGGHWRAIAGACLSALVLCGATLLIWGWPVWQAFLDSLPLTQSVIIEQGNTGWYKIQSAFSFVRYWGAGVDLAWAVQGVMTAAAVAGAAWVAWRGSSSSRMAATIAAALLSTPYVMDYDLVPLGLACALLVQDGRVRGFLTWEKTLYALVWIAPLIGRGLMQATGIPVGWISILAVFVVALRRTRLIDSASSLRGGRAQSAANSV